MNELDVLAQEGMTILFADKAEDIDNWPTFDSLFIGYPPPDSYYKQIIKDIYKQLHNEEEIPKELLQNILGGD